MSRLLKRKFQRSIGGLAIVVVMLGVAGFNFWRERQARKLAQEQAVSAQTQAQAIPEAPAPAQPPQPAEPEKETLPSSVRLKVPFTPQAPFALWDHLHQEACEEAAALMVARFWQKQGLTPEIAEAEILKLVSWEKQTFGYFEDTNAQEIARILKEYFGLKNVKVSYDISAQDLRRELAAGRPVIVPAAGRLLGNPFFRRPGPIYHNLVIIGYTAGGKFITNDPGTRRGAGFVYEEKTLINAIHDWPGEPEKITSGRKAMIVVGEPP